MRSEDMALTSSEDSQRCRQLMGHLSLLSLRYNAPGTYSANRLGPDSPIEQAMLGAAVMEFLGAVTVGARVADTIKNGLST